MESQPICGWDWLRQHQNDHTQAEIDSLSIVVSCGNRKLPPVSQGKKDQGLVKNLVKSYREERG